jgi:hypothetical protein
MPNQKDPFQKAFERLTKERPEDTYITPARILAEQRFDDIQKLRKLRYSFGDICKALASAGGDEIDPNALQNAVSKIRRRKEAMAAGAPTKRTASARANGTTGAAAPRRKKHR